jgi:hypothetical protein
MSTYWDEKQEINMIRSDVNDWYATLATAFNNTIDSNQNSMIIPESTKPSKTTKGQHLTRNRIKKVIFSNPATIVFWSDGSKKTVVKCSERDNFDPEKGLAMAIAKKFLGNKGNYYNTFVKYIPE